MSRYCAAVVVLWMQIFQLGAWAQAARGSSEQVQPAQVLARAQEAMGIQNIGRRILHYHAMMSTEQPYQSDRSYPPFFSMMSEQEVWYDPATRVLRTESKTLFPGSPLSPAAVTLDDGIHAESLRGEQKIAVSRHQATGRNLSPWAVVQDWSVAKDVRVIGTEVYRDYPRTVLARKTAQGGQRLYLDPKTGFPVKLDLTEAHYLWGQQHVEYVWSTWVMKDGVTLPGSAARVADGEVEISQTIGASDVVARESAPSLAAPQSPAQAPPDLPMFLRPIPPQVVTVSSDVSLLTNPGYNEGVALVNGEIYVFDATQGEERALQDAAAIAKLFPGNHKVNVVVTDLAWPHIAGVRYWVSQGGTVIAHAAARGFLQKIIDHRWTLAPDTLELKRHRNAQSVRLHFVGVDHPTELANGAVRLVPIDGIGSEVALMAYLPQAKFLWASDYIQTLDQPSLYAQEVLRAAERAGIEPERFAAEHLPLGEWKSVRDAQKNPAAAN